MILKFDGVNQEEKDNITILHKSITGNGRVRIETCVLVKLQKGNNVKVEIMLFNFPDFAEFLIKEGIDTISLTPDSVIKTIRAISNFK